jgi:hypothetical protein
VYRRADLSRTFVLVVALLLTAVSTGAFAREYRIPDPHIERHPIDAFHPRRSGAADLNRTELALPGTMTPSWIGRLRRVD